jgi:hypothetical protein
MSHQHYAALLTSTAVKSRVVGFLIALFATLDDHEQQSGLVADWGMDGRMDAWMDR